MKVDEQTICGNVYVQGGMEGLASYHFEKDGYSFDRSYISYASAPPYWRLSNGSPPPKKKHFENSSYDAHTKTFKGTVDWSPLNFNGDSRWEYRMVFSDNLLEIEGGEIVCIDAEGGNKEILSFGRDIFYEKLIG